MSLSQIKYLLLVRSYEVGSTQEMSMISSVNNDTESFYGLCLLLYVFPTKPLAPQISTIMNEDINIINFVTKPGTTPPWQ